MKSLLLKRRTYLIAFLTLAIFAVVILVFWPAVRRERGGDDVRLNSASKLKNIGEGVSYYCQANNHLPVATSFDSEGNALHGWHYRLLPYVENADIYSRIDHQKPWDHTDNSKQFQKVIKVYVHLHSNAFPNPNKEGFGITTYAGNLHVITNEPRKLADFANGASNVLLIGEMAGNYKAWGCPLNVRDPNLGLNRTPDGFGGPWRNGSQFVMADGSVRVFTNDTDPEFLKALAEPGRN